MGNLHKCRADKRTYPRFLTSSNFFLPLLFFVKIFIIYKEFMYFKSTLISSMNIKKDSKMQYMHNVVVARLCIIGTEMSRSPATPNTTEYNRNTNRQV